MCGRSTARPTPPVLPTLYDPFPNIALEALACGLPLLTSTTCGARELIRPDENGYVCEALDIPALSGFLDRLAEPGRAAAMGQAAHDSVRELSLERMARQLVGPLPLAADAAAGRNDRSAIMRLSPQP